MDFSHLWEVQWQNRDTDEVTFVQYGTFKIQVKKNRTRKVKITVQFRMQTSKAWFFFLNWIQQKNSSSITTLKVIKTTNSWNMNIYLQATDAYSAGKRLPFIKNLLWMSHRWERTTQTNESTLQLICTSNQLQSVDVFRPWPSVTRCPSSYDIRLLVWATSSLPTQWEENSRRRPDFDSIRRRFGRRRTTGVSLLSSNAAALRRALV